MACTGAQPACVQRLACEAPRNAINVRSFRRSPNQRVQRSLAAHPPLRQQSRLTPPAPVCQASGSSQPAEDQGGETSKLPQSREDAVQQAATAIAAQLGCSGGGKAKGFAGGTSCRKLTVDVPVVESGAEAMLQLARDILAALPKQLQQQFTIVSCTEDSAAGSGSSCGVPVVSLQQCVVEGTDLSGCLLFVGPTTAQLDAMMMMLAYWRGPGAVVLNADWSTEHVPVEQVAFIKSFEAIYCFLPLMVKVLFIGHEGAVFKWCMGGNPSATAWRIFGKEGNRLEAIGRMQQRPTNEDLETVFYNAFAVNNPLNRGVNFIRGLVGNKGKQ